jgi:hypothetical protein
MVANDDEHGSLGDLILHRVSPKPVEVDAEWADHTFNKVLDLLALCAPNISTPFLEIETLGDGIVKVTLLLSSATNKEIVDEYSERPF